MIDNIYTQNSTKNLRQNWTKSDKIGSPKRHNIGRNAIGI